VYQVERCSVAEVRAMDSDSRQYDGSQLTLCKVATNHGRRRHHCCEYKGVRWICMGGGAVAMPRIYDWLSAKVRPSWRGATERFWSMASETLCDKGIDNRARQLSTPEAR
jgi:hypothetical protein